MTGPAMNIAAAIWATARQDFIKARDLGFQPSYLEGLAPSEYLQRMDERDSAESQASAGSSAGAVSGSANATGRTVNLASNDSPAAASSGSASDQQQLQHQAEVDRLAQQQKTYKAQGLVDLGKQAEKAGNDQEALSQYTQAVDLDPTNQDAVQGRDRLLAKTGRGAERRRRPSPAHSSRLGKIGDAGDSV